ncbi:MAG: hypothetical protein H0W99_17320 [Acidobacteria bacterium]|nr:hypothetical protein [Acidobacteriota bacterium]
MSRYKATGATDSNDNELLIFAEVASAVNEMTLTNAATGNPPQLSATGGDTNIALKLSPKGSGQILLNGADVNQNGAAGGALTKQTLLKTTTAIPDATPTAIATVTVPNANHSAVLRILVAATLTGADAYESTRVVEYQVVLSRTTGANVVAAISALLGGQIATVAAGATLTSVLTLSAVSGAVGASNTFSIMITNTGSVAQVSKVVAHIEVINMEATGVTVA